MSRIRSKIGSRDCAARNLYALSVKLRLPALLAICLSCGFGQQLNASNGNSFLAPTMINRAGKNVPIFSLQSGLRLNVDTTWVGNRGYRPIRVTIDSAKPVTADTLVTIRFSAGGWRSSYRAINVEADLEVKQGLSKSISTFQVPQYVDWNSFGWDVWVDGVKDKHLCVERAGFNTGNTGTMSVGTFSTASTAGNLSNMDAMSLLQAPANGSIDFQDLDSANLPSNWIEYSTMDAVITTIPKLELAKVSAPQQLEALLRWVRAGGNLLVNDMGQDYSDLHVLDQLINAPTAVPDPTTDSTTEATKDIGRWRFLVFDEKGQRRLKDLVNLSMRTPADQDKPAAYGRRDSASPNRAADSRRWFVAQAFGLGTIFAIQEESNSRLNSVNDISAALERCALSENFDWATRHGNDPGAGNPNHNDWLIPDVGAAPVFEFQMLITLFVIAIGPVNYWLLKRRNQLPLLLITVPIAALATTAILFTYGFLADGIGVRVRARSLTMLDQPAGEVASWARLSYYAGIAPSDGLRMPSDTVVYPIQPAISRYNSFGRRQLDQQRSLEWAQQQRLTRGWLASRSPTQYLALTSKATQKQLRFEKQAEQFSAINQLGSKVLALVAQDDDGNIYTCDEIETDGTSVMQASNFIQAASKLRRFLVENQPQLPAGFDARNNRRRNQFGAATSTSLMELQFEAIVSPLASGWGERAFVAITETGIEVPLGVEGVTESGSFHLVRGIW